MELEFIGAARTVTGSCHLVDTGSTRFIVDCGMFQGPPEIEELNRAPFPFDPSSLDFVLLTHAHIDHSGLVPRLFKEGFTGKVYASPATVDLCRIMLLDSAHVQELEAGWQQRKARRAGEVPFEPLYTVDEAAKCLSSFEGMPFGQSLKLAPDVSVRLRRAGHILGSAIIEVQLGASRDGRRIVFSGDLGSANQPVVKDPEFIADADYLVIESTYGNRVHEDRMTCTELLKRVIVRTIERRGNVIIPAFAVARTQDVVFDIAELLHRGEIPPVEVFVDSPMAVSATEVFDRYRDEYDVEATALIEAGRDPFDFPGLHYVRTVEESRALNDSRGVIIISSSGMCEAGRIKHHLKHNLWRPECAVLFVGFQARGTLGRRLKDGAARVRVLNEEVAVKASIESIDGYSAHADRDALLYWVKSLRNKPLRTFVVHGEPDSAGEFAATLATTIDIWAGMPRRGDAVDLATGETTVEPGALEIQPEEASLPVARAELERAYSELVRSLDRARPADVSRLAAMMLDLARGKTA